MKRKIKSLRTKTELYVVYNEKYFIKETESKCGYNECSIKYIGFGRYLIGYYDEYKTGTYISSYKNLINAYKIVFTNIIEEVIYIN